MTKTIQKKTYTHESEASRFLSHSNDLTRKALIGGMNSTERINEWLEYEVSHERRKRIIGALNNRKRQIRSD